MLARPPWVTEHPEWFTTRADGSIAYAENPPKKYQDIYPLNFDNDPEGIYAEVLRVVRVWIDRGVTAFRVDNPHTKPLDFWEWLLAEVRATNPEVVFLSEAFTKPAMMHTLARIGFHQSYTYFTWRNTRDELAEYLTEVSGEAGAYMRPELLAHDPRHPPAVPPARRRGRLRGARGARRPRLAHVGIYSGYELVENVPRPGVEEQIDNEKYEYKPRDWALADEIGISTLLTRLNEIRRDHPALRQLRNLTVHPTTNDQVLAFSRHLPAEHSPTGEADTVVVVVNLDPAPRRSRTCTWTSRPSASLRSRTARTLGAVLRRARRADRRELRLGPGRVRAPRTAAPGRARHPREGVVTLPGTRPRSPSGDPPPVPRPCPRPPHPCPSPPSRRAASLRRPSRRARGCPTTRTGTAQPCSTR